MSGCSGASPAREAESGWEETNNIVILPYFY